MTSSPQTPTPPTSADLGTLDLIRTHDTYGILLCVVDLLEEAKGRCDRVNGQSADRGSTYEIRVADLMVAIGAVQEVAATL